MAYCGYDNLHTIATIEEDDLEYITIEVRKGGITNYFSNEFGIKNVLHGSNKSEHNFEFRHGHRKSLMIIVKLVKKKLNEKGVDAFIVEVSKPKEYNRKSQKDMKETKDMSVSTSELDLNLTETYSKASFHENFINLQAKLLIQTVRSLYVHSSDMYDEASILLQLR